MASVISADEYAERRGRLLERARARGATGYVVFDPTFVTYFTGFRFLSTERPVIYLHRTADENAIFVPEFELERTREEASFSRIETYPEYPGREHPMRILGRVARELGLAGTIAADADGYPGILGYAGPPLSEVTGARLELLGAEIEGMLMRKSPSELDLIRESGRWCAHAHRLLQAYSQPGVTEAEASLRAQSETTLAMLADHGTRGLLASGAGVEAGYRGQIGRRSAWAHAISHNFEFRRGDVLVTETGAPVWGYQAELERAVIVGEPTDRMRRLFGHMLGARRVAFDALVPGASCADVDGAVNAYFAKHDLQRFWRQHVGHGIGLRAHEAPFIDIGDHTRLEPGMVITIEPGLYDSDIGGFRHSDTVAITADGHESLTDYPVDIDSLTI